VDNIHDDKKRVEITLMHQRRASAADSWKDADSYNLIQLKAGQEVRLKLDSSETWDVFQTLNRPGFDGDSVYWELASKAGAA
jgi:hypothetical protein